VPRGLAKALDNDSERSILCAMYRIGLGAPARLDHERKRELSGDVAIRLSGHIPSIRRWGLCCRRSRGDICCRLPPPVIDGLRLSCEGHIHPCSATMLSLRQRLPSEARSRPGKSVLCRLPG
jgi:hypothetical protein